MYVWTTLSVRPAMGFLSKTQIWEDRCNRPDNVDSLQTRSSIRQVAHSKFRRPDNSLYGPDARATYMEIACIWSTIRTTILLVWTREALIRKLPVAKVRPSRWHGNTVQERLKSRKNFSEILESRSDSCPSGRLMSTVQTAPRIFKPNAYLNLQPINRGP